MFQFMQMAGNYNTRRVARYEESGIVISTAYVNDGKKDYETAVLHSKYNNGSWIIVGGYATKEEAQTGHDEWVKIMTAKKLPNYLDDCSNAEISQMAEALGCSRRFERTK
jgi:hypothetical protein